MARGRERHEAHQQAVAALGRSLSRRARSRCELCGDGGPLAVVEIPGGPEEPDEEWAVMLCARCRDLERADPGDCRFLEGSAWSETVPAQVLAVRHLRHLAADGVGWAADALDGLWLDEAIQARVDAGGLP